MTPKKYHPAPAIVKGDKMVDQRRIKSDGVLVIMQGSTTGPLFRQFALPASARYDPGQVLVAARLSCPLAYKPASRSALFTCALAIFRGCTQPVNGLPLITSGAHPSVCPIWAPICPSGSVIRRIGLRRNCGSPVSMLSKDCPARIPARSRIVVPERTQSNGAAGFLNPCNPAPQ